MKTIIFISASRTGHNFVMNQVQSWFPDEFRPQMLNYENIKAEDLHRTIFKWIEAGQIEEGATIKCVYIIRDLLNWWASYLKFVPDVAHRNYQNMFDVWVSHVKEAYELTYYTPLKYVVNYDTFRDRQYYREWLCDNLGGMYSEERIDFVPEAGKGSSFDGFRLPGRLLNTGKRWKRMTKVSYYRMMLEGNPEAVDLYKRNFNLTEEQAKFIDNL